MKTIFDALQHLDLRWPKNGMVSCPHHTDKTPSLKLYQDSYFCFSCGATGDGYGLIAALTGRDVADVLRELGGKETQRASSETIELVGPQAMQARWRRAFRAAYSEVFQQLHAVFGEFQDGILIAEIDRMGACWDSLKDRLLGENEWAVVEPPPIRKGLDLIETERVESLAYLEVRALGLFGGSAREAAIEVRRLFAGDGSLAISSLQDTTEGDM